MEDLFWNLSVQIQDLGFWDPGQNSVLQRGKKLTGKIEKRLKLFCGACIAIRLLAIYTELAS